MSSINNIDLNYTPHSPAILWSSLSLTLFPFPILYTHMYVHLSYMSIFMYPTAEVSTTPVYITYLHITYLCYLPGPSGIRNYHL